MLNTNKAESWVLTEESVFKKTRLSNMSVCMKLSVSVWEAEKASWNQERQENKVQRSRRENKGLKQPHQKGKASRHQTRSMKHAAWSMQWSTKIAARHARYAQSSSLKAKPPDDIEGNIPDWFFSTQLSNETSKPSDGVLVMPIERRGRNLDPKQIPPRDKTYTL